MIYTRQHTKPSSIVMGSLFKAHLFSNLAAEVDEMNTIAVDNSTVDKKRMLKKIERKKAKEKRKQQNYFFPLYLKGIGFI